MRVLVCGSRTFDDYKLLEETLDAIGREKEINTIIHGLARGADTLAGRYAKDRQIPVLEYPALWETHGRRAGPIRNAEMLRDGKPDLVVAFIGTVARLEFESGLSDSPYSRGTRHMIEISQKAGIKVIVHTI